MSARREVWKIIAEWSRESFLLQIVVAASKKEFRKFFGDQIKRTAVESNHSPAIKLA